MIPYCSAPLPDTGNRVKSTFLSGKKMPATNTTKPSATAVKNGVHERMDFSIYLDRRRIPNIDGLRGLAILLVLAHHIPASSVGWVAQFQQYGKHGVSLFFVISGYIVMTLMLREFRKSGIIDVRGFLARRLLRLWPLYYVILLIEAGLVYVAQVYSPENQALFTDKFACYALYCSNWLETSGQGPFFVSWSLAVEEQFYLLLSLVLLILRPAWLAVLFGGLLLVKIFLVNWVNLNLTILPWRIILSYSEAILLGTLLAFCLNERRFYLWFGHLTKYRIMPVLLILVLAGFLIFGNLGYKSSLDALAFYVICALLVGVCAVSHQLPIIGGKNLSWIGLVSYGIYLMHMPILSAVKKVTMEPMLVMFLTLVFVLPAAWLSYMFFEEPIRQWGRRNFGSKKTNQGKKPRQSEKPQAVTANTRIETTLFRVKNSRGVSWRMGFGRPICADARPGLPKR